MYLGSRLDIVEETVKRVEKKLDFILKNIDDFITADDYRVDHKKKRLSREVYDFQKELEKESEEPDEYAHYKKESEV